MTKQNKSADIAQQHAGDKHSYPPTHGDIYQSKGKYPEPSVCSGCGAVYHKGRWQWGYEKADAHKHVCPACQRIHDRVPAGVVNMSGAFFDEHRREILSLIHNIEAREKAEHPLQRIMSIHSDDHGTEVALTDFHIAHAIADALTDAYQGTADSAFTEKNDVMRINWTR
jgi:NMD protein affecting ribosome stability and mRNA decay